MKLWLRTSIQFLPAPFSSLLFTRFSDFMNTNGGKYRVLYGVRSYMRAKKATGKKRVNCTRECAIGTQNYTMRLMIQYLRFGMVGRVVMQNHFSLEEVVCLLSQV